MERGFIHSSTITAPVRLLSLFRPLPRSPLSFPLISVPQKNQMILTTIPSACSNGGGPENCQDNIFSLEGSYSNVNIYCLSTVGTTNMITINGATDASYSANVNVYPDTIALFQS
jgi:hypothetical protein